MKMLSLTALAVAAVMCCTSCYKQSTVSSSDNNNGGAGGSTSPGFNWTGTAPLSAKGNGVYQYAPEVEIFEFTGYYHVTGEVSENLSIGLSVPTSALPGQIFGMPSPLNMSWTTVEPLMGLGAARGQCKVVTNNATTLEGYFWADVKDYSAQRDTVINVTEGYFKVTKP